MSDAIKVGDRVLFGPKADSSPHIVAAIIGEDAWVKPTFYVGMGFIQPLDSLTRIEPEKVVLTPKYGKGDRVRGRHSHQIYTIEEPIDIKYRTAEGFNVTEHEVCPVPEPCPECKGSGVASEGGA